MAQPKYQSAAAAASVADTGAIELVVLTIPAPQFAEQTGAGLRISGSLVLNTAASGTTAAVVKVRRGSLTGTTILTRTVTATTSAKYGIPFDAYDQTGGESPTTSYVITVTETGASANGSVADVCATVEAIGA